jgi:hypothetical protein
LKAAFTEGSNQLSRFCRTTGEPHLRHANVEASAGPVPRSVGALLLEAMVFDICGALLKERRTKSLTKVPDTVNGTVDVLSVRLADLEKKQTL